MPADCPLVMFTEGSTSMILGGEEEEGGRKRERRKREKEGRESRRRERGRGVEGRRKGREGEKISEGNNLAIPAHDVCRLNCAL